MTQTAQDMIHFWKEAGPERWFREAKPLMRNVVNNF